MTTSELKDSLLDELIVMNDKLKKCTKCEDIKAINKNIKFILNDFIKLKSKDTISLENIIVQGEARVWIVSRRN